jgi:hypothetical protein
VRTAVKANTVKSQRTKYGFRLKFYLTPGCHFEGVRQQRRLLLNGISGRVYLVRQRQQRRHKFGAPVRYAIVGRHFANEDEATESGERLRNGLLRFAAAENFGLDVVDRYGAQFAQFIKDLHFTQTGVRLRDDKHGLDVYAEGAPIRHVRVEAYGSSTRLISKWQAFLSSEFVAAPPISPKQRLALDLLSLSGFDSRSKTKFLTLITIVEVLAQQRRRSTASCHLLDTFISRARAAKDPQAILLAGPLSFLKRQSIGESCRQLVESVASADEAVFFGKCYKIRSQLVHRGETNAPLETDRLRSLVASILLKVTAAGTRI